MPYEPKGKVANLMLAMRNRPQHLFDTKESALIMEVAQGQIGAYMLSALEHGVIFSKLIRGRIYYKSTPITDLDVAALCERLDHAGKPGHDDVRSPKVDPTWRPPVMSPPREGSGIRVPSLRSAVKAQAGTEPIESAPRPQSTPQPTAAPTPSPAPVPEEEVVDSEEEQLEPVEFNVARWMDGDVIVYGLDVNEDGSITFSSERAKQLYDFLGKGIA
jgi:hypothetical protein